MLSNTSILTLADPTEFLLELSPTDLNQAWEQSQSFSTSSRCWNAYLNRICLEAILSRLQEEYEPKARVGFKESLLPSYWEFINGTPITVGEKKIVIIPSEAIHDSELRVPQEWVDIPSWSADYYLAVQVNIDDKLIRVWGYATHQQLKKKGNYEAGDRTYCLAGEDLIEDINILWLAQQLCPEEPTRSEVEPLPVLPLQRAENLLQRLSNSAIRTPRLEVPFSSWGALVEHGGWRKILYQRRQGIQEQWSIMQWLSEKVPELARQVGWQRNEFQASTIGSRSKTDQLIKRIELSRQMEIAGQMYKLKVVPRGNPEDRIWRFELSNLSPGGRIPGGFKLRLLTEDLQNFESNEIVANTTVDKLDMEIEFVPGEGIVWETEPLPKDYDREILRF